MQLVDDKRVRYSQITVRRVGTLSLVDILEHNINKDLMQEVILVSIFKK